MGNWKNLPQHANPTPALRLIPAHFTEKHLRGRTLGDSIDAILSAAAMNFTKLIAWLKFFLSFLRALFSFVIPHDPLIQTAKS
jgi:hypothetical protein